MRSILENLGSQIGVVPEYIALAVLGLGVIVFFFGFRSAMAGPGEEIRRMHGTPRGKRTGRIDVLSRSDTDPTGILKFFVPTSKSERSTVARRLRQAGFQHPRAIRYYYLVRTFFGIFLPGVLLALIFLPPEFPLPARVEDFVKQLDLTRTIYILTILLVVGFYGPALFLKARLDERRLKIERGLPVALDLLQVAVEAGMGIDAAMNRIAREMVSVSPPIAEEFMTVQLEIQAGMERERAFLNMADRCGVDEVTAFANVILQSTQFGTSISAALETYATEMRLTRELKAQERANKLPVKMSGVMAAMMMPTLLMITLTPVAIRWMRAFSDI